MGVFDPFVAVIETLDAGIGGVVPPLGRLIIWAVIGSGVSMGLYRFLSNQEKIARLKAQLAETRRAIAAYEGEFDGIRPLLAHSIGLSLRQLAAMLVPAVIASLPLLLILVAIATTYGFVLPSPGEPVNIEVAPEPTGTGWSPPGAGIGIENGWRVNWPSVDSELHLMDEQGNRLLTLPFQARVRTLHKRAWWNLFWGNPLGYLPAISNVDRIEIDLPRHLYLGFGPAWLGRWEVVFFAVLTVFSLGIKVAFRIH